MKKRRTAPSPAALGLILAVAFAAAAASSAVQMPGPLSASHAVKPGAECAACHAAAAGEIEPAKCLGCHSEIASRIAAHQGFHRDKAGDCGTCHAEHQGRDVDLTHLDPADFDHSETGADLEGAHLKIDIRSCDTCHAKDRVLPRQTGRSYLLKVPGCVGCHDSPHPGREERCLACHDQDSWSVGRARGER